MGTANGRRYLTDAPPLPDRVFAGTKVRVATVKLFRMAAHARTDADEFAPDDCRQQVVAFARGAALAPRLPSIDDQGTPIGTSNTVWQRGAAARRLSTELELGDWGPLPLPLPPSRGAAQPSLAQWPRRRGAYAEESVQACTQRHKTRQARRA